MLGCQIGSWLLSCSKNLVENPIVVLLSHACMHRGRVALSGPYEESAFRILEAIKVTRCTTIAHANFCFVACLLMCAMTASTFFLYSQMSPTTRRRRIPRMSNRSSSQISISQRTICKSVAVCRR